MKPHEANLERLFERYAWTLDRAEAAVARDAAIAGHLEPISERDARELETIVEGLYSGRTTSTGQ